MKRLTSLVVLAALTIASPTAAETMAGSPPSEEEPQHTVCMEWPYGTPEAPCSTPWAHGYTVRRGDTLWRISTRLLGTGRRWREIAALNGVGNPRRLRVGTVLRLPLP